MSTATLEREELLRGVAAQLLKSSAATDPLLLMRWRTLALCQYLIGSSSPQVTEAAAVALGVFARQGPSAGAVGEIRRALADVHKLVPGSTRTPLPVISEEKRTDVKAALRRFLGLGPDMIEKAQGVVEALKQRLALAPYNELLAGLQHRLDYALGVLGNERSTDADRRQVAAAVLYVSEIQDAVPDTLDFNGLIDDDYALRITLESIGIPEKDLLHWAERIAALWDDLPFLGGVNLVRDGDAIHTTWLDRISSYACYVHALAPRPDPLLILEPSIVCTPLHSILVLVGLLVLERLTEYGEEVTRLQVGQTYEIDAGFFAEFDGVAAAPAEGWLRLRFGDGGVVFRPPAIAARMVHVPNRKLSASKEFGRHLKSQPIDPIQQFFNWSEAIGTASIPSRLIIVTSRNRASEMFDGVSSNGVHLLDEGVVRYIGQEPDLSESGRGLVLVTPTLATARSLVEKGTRVQAILVDGFQRLEAGRHHLPFILLHPKSPSVIAWAQDGYTPDYPPAWLPVHKRLAVSVDDLIQTLALDGENDWKGSTIRASLQQVATGLKPEIIPVSRPDTEARVTEALTAYARAVRSESRLPDYMRYHLGDLSTVLRLLVSATPTDWETIRGFALAWRESITSRWELLRTDTVRELDHLRGLELGVVSAMDDVTAQANSKGEAVLAYLSSRSDGRRLLVCSRNAQVGAVAALLARHGDLDAEPVLLNELEACSPCLVGGWMGTDFVRRLSAHTPRELAVFVDADERGSLDRFMATRRAVRGDSLLGTLSSSQLPRPHAPPPPQPPQLDLVDESVDLPFPVDQTDEATISPCVFVRLVGGSEVKVLAPESRVIVEDKDGVRERPARSLSPDDRVIIGRGFSRWSPAEEFTQAVVGELKRVQPEIVATARQWREALQRFQVTRGLSADELRKQLEVVGIRRELPTVEGWLLLERASPIGPRHLRSDLGRVWRLVKDYTESSLEDVIAACSRLRSLRWAAGRALLDLWKGKRVDLGVDSRWLTELVRRLRSDVQVRDIEAVTFGKIPSVLIGRWLPSSLASQFENTHQSDVVATADDHLADEAAERESETGG